MALWIMLLAPIAPVLFIGLLTEEIALLAFSALKAAYNGCAYGLSRLLAPRDARA